MTPADRKARPLYSGLFCYFPDALLELAHCSWVGNQQHSPGEPLHWAKDKSTDELDALLRHLTDRARGEVWDTSGSEPVRHATKMAWRAIANLQRELEAARASAPAGPAPAVPDAFERYRADVDGDAVRWAGPADGDGPGPHHAHD